MEIIRKNSIAFNIAVSNDGAVTAIGARRIRNS